MVEVDDLNEVETRPVKVEAVVISEIIEFEKVRFAIKNFTFINPVARTKVLTTYQIISNLKRLCWSFWV